MKLVDDKELLEGFRAGKPDALRRVYLHYAPSLYAYLRSGFSVKSRGQWFSIRGITDPVTQENVVQETFARCFRPGPRASYDGMRPFLPYLKTACHRILIEEKRHDRWVHVSSDELDNVQVGERPSAQELLETQEVQVLIRELLASLPDREQQVFSAIFEEGDSQQQAAERLGLGRMQVRTSLKSIRVAVLRHFRESGYLTHVQHKHSSVNTSVLLYLLSCLRF